MPSRAPHVSSCPTSVSICASSSSSSQVLWRLGSPTWGTWLLLLQLRLRSPSALQMLNCCFLTACPLSGSEFCHFKFWSQWSCWINIYAVWRDKMTKCPASQYVIISAQFFTLKQLKIPGASAQIISVGGRDVQIITIIITISGGVFLWSDGGMQVRMQRQHTVWVLL